MKKETEMRQVLRAIAIVTRNDPDEQEHVVVYPKDAKQ